MKTRRIRSYLMCMLILTLLFILVYLNRNYVRPVNKPGLLGNSHQNFYIQTVHKPEHYVNSQTNTVRTVNKSERLVNIQDYERAIDKKLEHLVNSHVDSVRTDYKPEHQNSIWTEQLMNIHQKSVETVKKPELHVNRNLSWKTVYNKTEYAVLNNHYFKCADPVGRLGNMMFEFASGLGIANTINYKFYIEQFHPLNKYFELKHVLNLKVENIVAFNEEQCRRKVWKHDKRYLEYNLTTLGFLQSWKYFVNSFEEIRNSFHFKPFYLNKAKAFLEIHTKANDTLIGFHVRRGDFVNYTKAGYTIADVNYPKKAIEFYKERYPRVLFVVVSNDIKWCQENIKGSDVIYSKFTDDPVTDLALLSLCQHSIITGGTFSWWSGWLAGGTVVYLRDYPRPGSWLQHEMQIHNLDDYYLPHWIDMSNGL